MKKGLFLLFVLLVLGSVDCFSQSDRWVSISEDSLRRVYYDTETIKYTKNHVIVYLWHEDLKDYYNHIIVKLKIFCNSYQLQKLSEVAYDKDGSIIWRKDNLTEKQDIIPASMGEFIYKYFCK